MALAYECDRCRVLGQPLGRDNLPSGWSQVREKVLCQGCTAMLDRWLVELPPTAKVRE